MFSVFLPAGLPVPQCAENMILIRPCMAPGLICASESEILRMRLIAHCAADEQVFTLLSALDAIFMYVNRSSWPRHRPCCGVWILTYKLLTL